ncbi:glycine--tRNA ligase subunit beta [Sphingomonas xanthus]|uniref:Glycine--tRNA ligase beta subunit n=1 Tax=Sphingomonas xanthus TaxID=2594473 RepID=A0A516ITB4_9SPHN|nr:glycine--tRNA ligase subunit beta [Sphingomonas xanthus]QDP20162.1 glycine--tRNA ligase subunit beta [Sphingomonas xanthus]
MSDRLASGATENDAADFLLELLSEEIPARMQAKARNDLARMMVEALSAAGLSHAGVDNYSTPRRLALIARDLPLATEAVREELKGPRTSAPPQALDGFLRKTGLTRDQLEDRDGTWFAVVDKPGRSTTDVLAEAVTAIIRDFPWPKAMRWGAASRSAASLRWVRPLHSIVALLGEKIVPVAIEGVSCGAATLGHRFHHPGPITIGGAHDYVEKLRACHVIVDQEEREAIIRKGTFDAAEDAGFLLVEDEGLVVENAGLTEWPRPLLGGFDPEYLDVPEEVIQLTARINQKYFVMRSPDGKLAPHFVCTANIDANDGGEAIVAGNERVLAARLSDARFFWEQDLKLGLEEFLPKLESMLFYEGMGSLRAKADRMAELSARLARDYFPECDPEIARRAGLLAKADLATGMVGEFPELQGVMGSYYADRQGEEPGTVAALRQQYEASVEGPVAVCVALADRLDTLAAFFARGIKPTGSKDPFALRRAALQTILTILSNGTRLRLQAALEQAKAGLGAEGAALDVSELLAFFADRLKVQQREAGVRHDLIDAVFALGGEDDLVRLLARVTALQGFVTTGEGGDLLAGYKRAANILKKEKWDLPRVMTGKGEQGIPQTGEEDPLVLVEEPAIAAAVREMATGSTQNDDAPAEEVALVAALDRAEPDAARAVAAEDFTAAMTALASLRAPIDAFFDKVTVNDSDAEARKRRLNLLARFRDAVHNVADFSKIEG